MTIIITLIILLPLAVFLVWQYMQAAKVTIDSGHVGLLIARGKASETPLLAGVHYIWPFRQQSIQIYSLREMSYLAAKDGDADAPPLPIDLHNGAEVQVSYLVRYRIDPDHIARVHEAVGPEGVPTLARDYASQTVVDALTGDRIEMNELIGEGRRPLEEKLRKLLAEKLGERGIVVTLFGIRDVDRGMGGQVLRQTERARLEVRREEARAEVRQARLDHDLEQANQVADLSDNALRYLQIQAWREYVDKWDGKGQLPATAMGPVPGPGKGRRRPNAEHTQGDTSGPDQSTGSDRETDTADGSDDGDDA